MKKSKTGNRNYVTSTISKIGIAQLQHTESTIKCRTATKYVSSSTAEKSPRHKNPTRISDKKLDEKTNETPISRILRKASWELSKRDSNIPAHKTKELNFTPVNGIKLFTCKRQKIQKQATNNTALGTK